MKRIKKLAFEFIEFIPSNLEDGVIYISVPFSVAVHKCCCGCGMEVVTPISRHDWRITFDGETVSLYPSIGNWSFSCKSHYWIIENKVKWMKKWTDEEIERGRLFDITKRIKLINDKAKK